MSRSIAVLGGARAYRHWQRMDATPEQRAAAFLIRDESDLRGRTISQVITLYDYDRAYTVRAGKQIDAVLGYMRSIGRAPAE